MLYSSLWKNPTSFISHALKQPINVIHLRQPQHQKPQQQHENPTQSTRSETSSKQSGNSDSQNWMQQQIGHVVGSRRSNDNRAESNDFHENHIINNNIGQDVRKKSSRTSHHISRNPPSQNQS
jgi:hypothetical protein